MQKLDFALEFEKVNSNTNGIPVIIVAAGSSSRMKGTDKQMAELCGIPVIVRTLRAFENCAEISEITVVTRKEKIADISNLGRRYAVGKLKNVIEGGACRAESVMKGVMLYKDVAPKVLVHDGARPLVSNTVISNVVAALKDYNSVTCAVKINDTVKRVNEKGIATEMVSREGLVSIQTPQGVAVNKFLMATQNADLTAFTDDTSVMESVGEQTKIVEGSTDNIKITTPEDMARAELILRKEW